MSVLADAWVSRAAAKQRRGRAGRVSPGARFALFSRAQFARMSDHQPPEMLRTPLQQLCLNVKAMAPGVGVETTLCAAPTPPPRDAVRAALDELMALRALDVRRDSATSASSDGAVSSDAEKHPNNPETLTPLGKHLAHMPVDARVGKMLLFGALLGCLDPILTIAAAMSGRQLFVSPKDKKAEADAMKKKIAAPGKSDHLTMASAYAAWWKCPGAGARRKHADERFLSHQALEGIMASRLDYAGVLADLGFIPRVYVRAMRRDGAGGGDADRNASVARVVKAALVAGFYPQVVRVQHPETKFVNTAGGAREKESVDGRGVKYFCKDVGRVFLHPSSVNVASGKFDSPWLVYSERVETARVYVRDNTMVGAYALLLFGGELVVDHARGRLSMDGWAEFDAPARVGVLVREMRAAVDALLEKHIDQPREEDGDGDDDSMKLASSPVVKALLELLASEGR